MPLIGEPFNPYQQFYCISIPDCIARHKKLSSTAKLAYGRLMKYAGKDGMCYPATKSVGDEIGRSGRQVASAVLELETEGLLKRIPRLGQSNAYQFIWHALYEGQTKQDVDEQRASGILQPLKDSSTPEEYGFQPLKDASSPPEGCFNPPLKDASDEYNNRIQPLRQSEEDSIPTPTDNEDSAIKKIDWRNEPKGADGKTKRGREHQSNPDLATIVNAFKAASKRRYGTDLIGGVDRLNDFSKEALATEPIDLILKAIELFFQQDRTKHPVAFFLNDYPSLRAQIVGHKKPTPASEKPTGPTPNQLREEREDRAQELFQQGTPYSKALEKAGEEVNNKYGLAFKF